MDIRLSPSNLSGTIYAPPSKSDSHRRIICAAFASGDSIVDNISLSKDIEATLRCISAAGSSYDLSDSIQYPGRHCLKINGTGGECRPARKADCGESGSTLRFMSMVFAAAGGMTELTGHGRLPFRPMDGAFSIFDENDIKYETPGEGKYLPLIFTGELPGGSHVVESSLTSQYLSGILMGLPAFSKKGMILAGGKFESRGYVEVTKSVLSDFGIEIKGDNPFFIPRNNGLQSAKTRVEGDWSNASYFFIMNALGSGIEIKGLDSDSRQPDSVLIKLIRDIRDNGAGKINVSECPDLMPSLAVLGAAGGKYLRLTGGRRLRAKESDRIKSVAAGLKSLGVKTEEFDDGLGIYGTGVIRGGEIDSFNDHRIAMAFASLCVVSEGDIVIRGAQSVSKSYPSFFDEIRRLGGKIE